MRFTKFAGLSLLLIFLIGFSAISARAQKKDEQNKSSLIATTPVTPYSNVERDSLLNGLQIISREQPTDNTVRCWIVIRAGSIFDLTGKTGQAKLTQDTLLAVNPRLKEEIESLQGKIDWGLNWDTTWFKIEAPANNLDAAIEILARLLVVETIRPDAFKKAQTDLLEKLKSSQSSPAEKADEQFFKALYGDHPYGHNIDGDQATLAGIKQGDIYDFLRRFYIANNASVVIVGNISHARAMRAFKVFFGGWTKGQIIAPTFRPPLPAAQVRSVKIEDPQSTHVEIRGGLLGVRHNDPDFIVTEILARIVAARLKKSIGDIAPEFLVQARPRILSGPLYFSATVASDKSAEIYRLVAEQFDSLARIAVTDEELAEAKSGLMKEYEAKSVEHYLREIEVYSLPRDYPSKIKGRIEAVTTADAQRVSKKLRDANAATIVLLGKDLK